MPSLNGYRFARPPRPNFYAQDIFLNFKFQRITFPYKKALTVICSHYHPSFWTSYQEMEGPITYSFLSRFSSLTSLAPRFLLLTQKKKQEKKLTGNQGSAAPQKQVCSIRRQSSANSWARGTLPAADVHATLQAVSRPALQDLRAKN